MLKSGGKGISQHHSYSTSKNKISARVASRAKQSKAEQENQYTLNSPIWYLGWDEG